MTMTTNDAELVQAIRERDELIASVRAHEAAIAPVITAMWESSRRVEDLAKRAPAEE